MVGRKGPGMLLVDGGVLTLTWTFAVIALVMIVRLLICLFHLRDPFPEWVGLVELLDVCHVIDVGIVECRLVAKLDI